jgi:hypothetical protein
MLKLLLALPEYSRPGTSYNDGRLWEIQRLVRLRSYP